jgi:uncharacterized membrane protein
MLLLARLLLLADLQVLISGCSLTLSWTSQGTGRRSGRLREGAASIAEGNLVMNSHCHCCSLSDLVLHLLLHLLFLSLLADFCNVEV